MASGPTTEPLPPSDQSENSTSNSEQYDGNTEQFSSSNPSAHQPALILYTPPTVWGLVRGAAINVLLPFVNGLMLGFGELFAHELAFRLGWSGTKIFPKHRASRTVGPGVEMQIDPVEQRRRDGTELQMYTSLE